MAIRYIVRPGHIVTTPNALKTALEAQAVVRATRPGLFDPKRDLFLAYPPPSKILPQSLALEGQTASYHNLYDFFSYDKYHQRRRLYNSGVKVPLTKGLCVMTEWDAGDQCVLRPKSHMAGSGFEIVRGDHVYNTSTHYLSQQVIRTHEYRVIYAHGKRVCTLIKVMPEGISQDVPWTLANGAVFKDIGNRWDTHRLHTRGAYEALDAFYVCKDAHLCAVDVALTEDSYVVFEINFCPSLKVEARLAKVAQAIKAHRAIQPPVHDISYALTI